MFCHLYQTNVASVFAALLLFICYIFQFNWFVFILFKSIFKVTFMFKQTWKILLDKCSKTYVNNWKFLVFLLPVLFI